MQKIINTNKKRRISYRNDKRRKKAKDQSPSPLTQHPCPFSQEHLSQSRYQSSADADSVRFSVAAHTDHTSYAHPTDTSLAPAQGYSSVYTNNTPTTRSCLGGQRCTCLKRLGRLNWQELKWMGKTKKGRRDRWWCSSVG